jgi:hypothetical protein
MALFEKEHIKKILEGIKTQTRRRHRFPWKSGRVYRIKTSWFNSTSHRIRIIRRYRQRLRDITPEEVRAEGYSNLEEFRRAWEKIYGLWDPDEEVWVYEFKLID